MWQLAGERAFDEPGVEAEGRRRAVAPGKRTLTMGLSPRPAVAQLKAEGDAPARGGGGASSGGALDVETRAAMEAAFAVDFGAVRVHVDGAAESLGAAAFARGDDLHFAAGRYQPGTSGGQHLLAHELAHVVQQRDGRVRAEQAYGGVLVDHDAGLEAEADRAADRVVRGEPAGLVAGGGGGGGGAAPIQASFDIGGAAFNNLLLFKQHIAAAAVAAPQQARQAAVAANTHDGMLQTMLAAGYVYRYSDVDALLIWLEANHAAPPAAPGDAANVGAQLAGLRSFKFVDDFVNAATILNDLQGNAGWRLVICPEDVAQVTAYFDGAYNAVQAQIVMSAVPKLEVAVGWIAARHGVTTVALGGVAAFVNHQPTIVQNPQERGDMHDVKVALALDPNLRVVFALDDHRRRAESEDILGYYGAHARVRLCGQPYAQVRGQVPFANRQSVSRSTEIIARGAQNNRAATEQAIVEETTGLPQVIPPRPHPFPAVPADAPTRVWQALDDYDQDLVNRGHFVAGTNYIIINYRESGHNVAPPRAPSHPELDTGTDGYDDLVQAVIAAGFTPVAMGEPPVAPAGGAANLVRYWLWPSCAARPNQQTKRQAEYGLLRRLNEQYSVKALAMRSGATDAMVFAGIETISIDLATETFTPGQLGGTGLDPSTGSAASWRRASKRESIRPGKFHQGFLVEPRQDAVVPAPGANWTGAIDPGLHPAPIGAAPPASANSTQVTALIAQFFGTNAAPVAGNYDLDPQSPLVDVDNKAVAVHDAHRDQTRATHRAAAALHAGRADAQAWAVWRAGQLRNGGGGATAVANRMHAAAQAALVRATALRAQIDLDILAGGGAPPAHLAPTRARVDSYVTTLTAAVIRTAAIVGQIAALGVVANGLTDDQYGDHIADLEGWKEAAEFCEFAVKQLDVRITTDDGVRTGAIQL